jgi:hypothetical protein
MNRFKCKRPVANSTGASNILKKEFGAMENVHIVHNQPTDSWCVHKGAERVRCYGNERDAVNYGQFLSRKRGSQLTIHNEEGAIKSVVSYEPDEVIVSHTIGS